MSYTPPHSSEGERAVLSCNKCGTAMALDQRARNGFKKNGEVAYRNRCVPCDRIEHGKTARKSYDANKVKYKARAKSHRQANKDQVNARTRELRKLNPDRYKKYGEKYRARHPERVVANYKRNWARRFKKPEERIKSSVRGRFYKALKAAALGKPGSALDFVGCSVPELMAHLQSKFQDGMTWDNYGKWHVDHITPVVAFDFNNRAQVEQCFHFTNLQPLWAKENHSKGPRHYEFTTI